MPDLNLILKNITRDLRHVTQKNSAQDQDKILEQYNLILQHYIWKEPDNTSQKTEAKKIYRKLSLYFHPDKQGLEINQADPTLLQKEDIQNITSLLGEPEIFFKQINQIYHDGQFNPNLEKSYQHFSEQQPHHSDLSPPQEKTKKSALFLFLKKAISTEDYRYLKEIILQFSTKSVLEELIKNDDGLYLYLAEMLAMLQSIKKTSQNINNQFILQVETQLEKAIMDSNIPLAKLFIQYGACNIENLYTEALEKNNDVAIYTLLEALPKYHLIHERVSHSDIAYTLNSYCYLKKLCREYLITPITCASLSVQGQKTLNSPEIYHLILRGKISIAQALSFTADELKFIQFPQFLEYAFALGDFNKALANIKNKSALLNSSAVIDLLTKGLQHIYRVHPWIYYGDYKTVSFQYILSLNDKQLDTLNNASMMRLVYSGLITLDQMINLKPEYQELVLLPWVQNAIRHHQDFSSPMDTLGYISKNISQSEINFISNCHKHFHEFNLTLYLKLSLEEKLKLAAFMPISSRYNRTIFHPNGFTVDGLNFDQVLNLPLDFIKKLSYPFSADLYFKQNKMGKYLLEAFPLSFFEENKNSTLSKLIDNALFYASQHNMPRFIELHANQYGNPEINVLKNLTYYFNQVYQKTVSITNVLHTFLPKRYSYPSNL